MRASVHFTRDIAHTGLGDEETLHAVWDAVADALALSGPDGRVLAVNRAYCELYGLPPEDLVGQPFSLIFPEAERAAADEAYAQVFREGAATVHESVVKGSDGSELIVEARASFIERAGTRIALLSTIRDVTEARTQDRKRAELLASITHDLRQPAAVIRAQAGLLKRRVLREEALDRESLTRSIESIAASATQLSEQLLALQDLASVQRGEEIALDRQPTDLGALARDLVTEHQSIAESHLLRVEVRDGGLEGMFDRVRLRRVLSNLLSNAIKYSPPGSEVEVLVERAETGVSIEVRDQGVGIPPEELEDVFLPYRRGSNVSNSVAGTGIGLWGVRHIVQEHGGTISVASEVGNGSAFTVWLPLRDEEQTSPRARC